MLDPGIVDIDIKTAGHNESLRSRDWHFGIVLMQLVESVLTRASCTRAQRTGSAKLASEDTLSQLHHHDAKLPVSATLYTNH